VGKRVDHGLLPGHLGQLRVGGVGLHSFVKRGLLDAFDGLSALDKLRPETIAILSTIAGYLLAQQRRPPEDK
jgi:hypothetical protein